MLYMKHLRCPKGTFIYQLLCTSHERSPAAVAYHHKRHVCVIPLQMRYLWGTVRVYMYLPHLHSLPFRFKSTQRGCSVSKDKSVLCTKEGRLFRTEHTTPQQGLLRTHSLMTQGTEKRNTHRRLHLLQLLENKFHLFLRRERSQQSTVGPAGQLGVIVGLLCVCDFQAGVANQMPVCSTDVF